MADTDVEEKAAVSSCSDDLKGLNSEEFQLIDTAFDLLDLERPSDILNNDNKDVDKSECQVTSTDDINPPTQSKEQDGGVDSQESPSREATDEPKKTTKRKKAMSTAEDGSPKKKKISVSIDKNISEGSEDLLLFDDSKLPRGWTRKVVQRKSGQSAGKFDVYVFSPDGKKLRSRVEVQAYLDENGITDIPSTDIFFGKANRKGMKTPKKEWVAGEKTPARRRVAKSLTPKKTPKSVPKAAATTVKKGRRPAAITSPPKTLPVTLPFSAKKKTPFVTKSPSSSAFRKSLAGRRTSTRNTPIQSSRKGRVIIPTSKDSPEAEEAKPKKKDVPEKAVPTPAKKGRIAKTEIVEKNAKTPKKEKAEPESDTDYSPKKSSPKKKGKQLSPLKTVVKGKGRPALPSKATKKAVKLALKRVSKKPRKFTQNETADAETPKKRGRSVKASDEKQEVDSEVFASPTMEKPTSSGRKSRMPSRFAESPSLPEKPTRTRKTEEAPPTKNSKVEKKGKKGKKGKVATKMMTRGKHDALTKRNIEKETKALEQDVELLKNLVPMVSEESQNDDDSEFVTVKTKALESPLKETPISFAHSDADESGHESIVIDKTEDSSPNPFKSRYLRKKGPNKAVEALKKVPAGYTEAISQTVQKKRTTKTPMKKKLTPKAVKISAKKQRSFSPVDLGLPAGLTMTSSGRTVRAPNRISPSPPPERERKSREETPQKVLPPPPTVEASPPLRKEKPKPKLVKIPRKPKITRKSPKAPKPKPVHLYDDRHPPSDLDDRKEYPDRSSRNPYLDYIMSSDHARSPSPEDFLFDSIPNSDIRRPGDLRQDRRKPAPVIKVPSKRKAEKGRFTKFPASESDSDDLFDPHKENRFRKMHPELDDSIDDLDMIELQLQVTGGRHDGLTGKHAAAELLSKVESPISMELIDALRDHDYYFRPMRELHLPSSMMSEDSNSLPLG